MPQFRFRIENFKVVFEIIWSNALNKHKNWQPFSLKLLIIKCMEICHTREHAKLVIKTVTLGLPEREGILFRTEPWERPMFHSEQHDFAPFTATEILTKLCTYVPIRWHSQFKIIYEISTVIFNFWVTFLILLKWTDTHTSFKTTQSF